MSLGYPPLAAYEKLRPGIASGAQRRDVLSQLTFDAAAVKGIEAIYLTPDVVAQRARVIELLAPTPGEQILDVGVGPGLLALDLARLVGESGRLVGLDVAPAMVAAATARLAGLPQAEVRVGDAAELDLPDGAFDAAVSTQAYEYVADMPRALSELRRVLRPGGRAVILDTDWRSLVWHSSDPARMDRMLKCWDDHLSDPHLPAKLGRMLRDAGFEVRKAEIVPMFSPLAAGQLCRRHRPVDPELRAYPRGETRAGAGGAGGLVVGSGIPDRRRRLLLQREPIRLSRHTVRFAARGAAGAPSRTDLTGLPCRPDVHGLLPHPCIR